MPCPPHISQVLPLSSGALGTISSPGTCRPHPSQLPKLDRHTRTACICDPFPYGHAKIRCCRTYCSPFAAEPAVFCALPRSAAPYSVGSPPFSSARQARHTYSFTSPVASQQFCRTLASLGTCAQLPPHSLRSHSLSPQPAQPPTRHEYISQPRRKPVTMYSKYRVDRLSPKTSLSAARPCWLRSSGVVALPCHPAPPRSSAPPPPPQSLKSATPCALQQKDASASPRQGDATTLISRCSPLPCGRALGRQERAG